MNTASSFFPRLRFFIYWFLLRAAMAGSIGSACAFFLWSLNKVTQCRFDHPWLLFFLPLAGLAVGLIYHYWGKSIEEGNNLILEQIHEPGGGIPRRMGPLILVATLVTHLFGGSVGREGTAVQMGGSIAGLWGKWFRLPAAQMRILLMSGVAAGFGAVFGTPFAGAIFALEVLTTGIFFRGEGIISVLLAATVGDLTCRAWGTEHLLYSLPSFSSPITLSPLLLFQAAVVGIASGIVVRIFVMTEHGFHRGFQKISPYAPLRPFLGGLLIILLVAIVGTRSYLGLGEWSPNPNDVTLATFFAAPHVSPWAWAWKLLFTAVTLSSGFKGGEVSPLFFIGAGLGNALSVLLGAPFDLCAAMGFVAVFAGASNTPIACTIMSIELFGSSQALPMAIACFVSYFCSRRSGIYHAQRLPIKNKFL